MRDLVVREALQTMARDAAKRLRELVAAGHQIPYDVEESGSGSPLPQYVPLTERFIRDQLQALAELDSFGSGCAAIESADLAGPYLDELGIEVPADGPKRAELAGVAFLCRLWGGSTDFSLDPDRMAAAVGELEAGGEAADDEIEVVVPLRGVRLPVVRLELATATIVRADTVEVPAEARALEGAGAAGWEPAFLAATRVSAAGGAGGDPEPKPDAGARAVEAFRQVITALRLFKPGSAGLGPYAWTRVRVPVSVPPPRAGGRAGADDPWSARAATNQWRRIATGAGRIRPGSYVLAEEELGDLVTFSRVLAYRSTAFGVGGAEGGRRSRALARAISRFESGLERNVVLEALNDYMLALRFTLEGGGPADLGLPMRVAALCAEPGDRRETKEIVDRALALERELWSGEPAPGAEDAPTPAETATAIEDLVRAILTDAACGHLGGDLRSTADEILLADGLAAGEGRAAHRGGSAEWDLPQPDEIGPDAEPEETQRSEVEPAELREEPGELPVEEPPIEEPEELPEPEEPPVEEPDELPTEEPEEAPVEEPDELPVAARQGIQEELWMDVPDDWEDPRVTEKEEFGMQVPEPRGRIRIESRPHPEEENVFTNPRSESREVPSRSGAETSDRAQGRLAELLEARPREPDRRADRVAYLFPRPETTEWNVRELSYDRRRRAKVHAS